MSKKFGDFFTILWPSRNIWTLPGKLDLRQLHLPHRIGSSILKSNNPNLVPSDDFRPREYPLMMSDIRVGRGVQDRHKNRTLKGRARQVGRSKIAKIDGCSLIKFQFCLFTIPKIVSLKNIRFFELYMMSD